MDFIDTHTHLYLPEFDHDRDEMVQRAIDSGVQKFFLPNIDSSTIQSLFALAAENPDRFFPMVGLHPCSVKENWSTEILIIKETLFKLNQSAIYGIGETGLDYYWDKIFIEEQQENFQLHIDWAMQLDLPVIIHSRDALNDCISIIQKNRNEKLRGIFHCFSGNVEQAQQITDIGFYIGIGGVLTFKNSGLDKVAEQIDLKHIVLETDAPYLAPVPFRGKRNESSYITRIAEKMASIKSSTVESIAEITTANARKLFKI
ncbi:MAG: TatD family hydrolase [Chitinophagales bacterium]|nr:TatD family hydrolase [Chitinophagales bacterium]